MMTDTKDMRVFPTDPSNDCEGLSFRQYAAVHIMAGFAEAVSWDEARDSHHRIIAKTAVRWADALAEALTDAPKPVASETA